MGVDAPTSSHRFRVTDRSVLVISSGPYGDPAGATGVHARRTATFPEAVRRRQAKSKSALPSILQGTVDGGNEPCNVGRSKPCGPRRTSRLGVGDSLSWSSCAGLELGEPPVRKYVPAAVLASIGRSVAFRAAPPSKLRRRLRRRFDRDRRIFRARRAFQPSSICICVRPIGAGRSGIGTP
jgi:hypothetical protein